MTAAEFVAAYGATATAVCRGTGIDAGALLAQWANETDWGTAWAGMPYNLGNIRNGPGGSIISYDTMDDFIANCIATWHNGYYEQVLLAQGAAAQLAAICASPWSAGHYGGTLGGFYAPILAVMAMSQDEFNALVAGSPLANVLGTATSTYKAVEAVKAEVEALKAQVAAISLSGPTAPQDAPKVVSGTFTGTVA